jgi:serine O-acetyltransferase
MSHLQQDIRRLAGNDRRETFSNLLSWQFLAIFTYRLFHRLQGLGLFIWPIRFPVERTVEMMTGICIPALCEIGPGLKIHHFGGIVLHHTTKIGKNATLFHQVTIGLAHDDQTQAPCIGDNVIIGAGAKILGPLRIGNNVTIGANAVVVKDIPDNCVVGGIPAKIIKKKR